MADRQIDRQIERKVDRSDCVPYFQPKKIGQISGENFSFFITELALKILKKVVGSKKKQLY